MGFRLKSTVAAAGLCLAMVWPAHQALASEKSFDSTIDLLVAINGRQTDLFIAAGLSSNLLSNEVLGDGTRHAQFQLPTGFGLWQLDGSVTYSDPGDILTDSAFFPHIDTYLTPSGASYLTFGWTFWSPCHGGCVIQSELFFRLDSTTSSLFGDGPSGPELPDINTAAFSRGEGLQALTREPLSGEPSSTYLIRFSVVPEPDVGLLILAGGVVSLAGVARRSRAGTA